MKLLVTQLSSPSRHSIPLWSKYSPQHPVLKHPQFMFLPYCQRETPYKGFALCGEKIKLERVLRCEGTERSAEVRFWNRRLATSVLKLVL
jgi:hypothetical protein